MLKIKRETDYAVRCIAYLAANKGRVVEQGEIARAMRIPRTFLAKILQKLAKAGLVTSFLGASGGFKLSRAPARITLHDVIVATEGPVAMNLCTVNRKACALGRTCKVHPFWVEVRAEVEKLLTRIDFEKIATDV